MPPTEQVQVQVNLDCCGHDHMALFDHDDAPGFPMNRFRKNISCPSCSRIVILTLTVGSEGDRELKQEVI
jgi:hypothetical protein